MFAYGITLLELKRTEPADDLLSVVSHGRIDGEPLSDTEQHIFFSLIIAAGGKHHEKCPRNALGASRKNARETVILARHGEWAVDVVSCRGHREVRQG
ncbi:MAG TPA: hypothetical protein VF874_21115, partial [Mycobacterium sp.]